MITVTALLHDEFRRMLAVIAGDEERTEMERELAQLALMVYDVNPEHPGIVAIVNRFTKRALDAS
jgi:hypothetical protein